jgi:hypothetical protein
VKYLPEAFWNLEFALKLLAYVEDGRMRLEDIEFPHVRQSEDGSDSISLERPTFQTQSDLLKAVQNNVSIAVGAAAITLNRCIEESGYFPGKIEKVENEFQSCIAVIYQIRNAFAHDIAEPKWEI